MATDMNDGNDVLDLFAESIGDNFLNIFFLHVSLDIIPIDFHDKESLTFEDIDRSKILIL